jgi:hypothetical protein
VEEPTGIYREEVLVMMGALADISTDTQAILELLGWLDEEDDDEAQDDQG